MYFNPSIVYQNLKLAMQMGIAGLVFTSVSACSTTQAAIALDSITTQIALQQGATELNPLLGDSSLATPMAAALISSVATTAFPQIQPQVCRLKLGVSANNIAVLAGASFPASLLPAVMTYAMSARLCKPTSAATVVASFQDNKPYGIQPLAVRAAKSPLLTLTPANENQNLVQSVALAD